jgi:hypothetical protein
MDSDIAVLAILAMMLGAIFIASIGFALRSRKNAPRLDHGPAKRMIRVTVSEPLPAVKNEEEAVSIGDLAQKMLEFQGVEYEDKKPSRTRHSS